MTQGDSQPRNTSASAQDTSTYSGKDLPEFVNYLKSAGQPCLLSLDGTQAWTPGVRAELMRLPVECTSPPDKNVLREVFGQKGIWLASFMLEPMNDRPANCFDYLCTDPAYCIENLTKNGRRDIRRGLRNFAVRRCTWDELLDKGLDAYADTEARHVHGEPSRDDLVEIAELYRDSPFVEIWGAWSEDVLDAWIKVLKIDDWAFITNAYSRNENLRNCPNNGLAYEVTKTCLVDEGRKSISFGISSLQATSNILSLHKFKIRMGYKAVPMCRTFIVHPLMRPMVKTRLASWIWDGLAALRPGSATFSKIAGMARLLSARETAPLAWAEQE